MKIIRRIKYKIRNWLGIYLTDISKNNINEKIKFEQDILSLLEKYKLYNKELMAIQKINIELNVEDLPQVMLKYLLINKEGK